MNKKETIEDIVDGHVTDIENWIARDPGSLRVWLLQVLKLDELSKNQIRDEFEVYLSDEEEP